MKQFTAFFALFTLFGLLSFPAFAQTITAAPNTMNFQGRLARKDGTPVPDGTHGLIFRIYDSQTGGNIKWAEQIGPLTTKNGSFSAVLGKVFPFTDTILNGNVWLEVQVDTDAPLVPRQQFQSVAYALKANTVPDGAITTPKIADGAITAAKLASGLTFAPTGAAGGDLTGTYPNPFLSNDTVNASRLASDAASLSKVSHGVLSVVGHNIYLPLGDVIGHDPPDAFSYQGQLMGNYCLGWMADSDYPGGGTAWLSGYAAIKFFTTGSPRLTISGNGNVGINTTNPQSTLDVNGTITASAVQVTGADVAEPYTIAAANDVQPAPGIVVVIQPHTPGRLQVSQSAYDRKVAGIISGANGVKPGLVLRQPGTLADGNLPVASSGRVYCWCDADANGPIEEGDQLTTSNTPGHAMRVSDYEKARGSILGKAMTSLKSGKGMILVLVTLQ